MQKNENRPDHISVSQVRKYQICGLQYYFSYIEKIPYQINDNMLRGIAVDNAANTHFDTKAQNELGVTQNDFVDLAVNKHDEEADDTEFKEATKDESRDKTVGASKTYHGVHGQNLTPGRSSDGSSWTQVKLEEDIGDGLVVTGFADLITDKNTIVDTKVRKADKVVDVEADLQLQTYANFIGSDQVAIASVTTAKTPKASYYSGRSTKKTKERAIQRIKSVSDAIDSNIFLPAPEGSWVCSERYCSYWNLCDYGSKRK